MIIDTNQPVDNYWIYAPINFGYSHESGDAKANAILRYEGASVAHPSGPVDQPKSGHYPPGVVSNITTLQFNKM